MTPFKPRYWMTSTAKLHYRKAISDTRDRWGIHQAHVYRKALTSGFQYIAENHRSFNSPHREWLAGGSGFRLHLIEHRYVVFQEHGDDIIIAAIFHESMDIPRRLKELQNVSEREMTALKHTLRQLTH
jgi:plasmid stabilization system protein ParE